MNQHHFYNEMVYSDSNSMIKDWAPLAIEGRDKSDKVAATYTIGGTDVNFGALTGMLTHSLLEDGVSMHVDCKVTGFKRYFNKLTVLICLTLVTQSTIA